MLLFIAGSCTSNRSEMVLEDKHITIEKNSFLDSYVIIKNPKQEPQTYFLSITCLDTDCQKSIHIQSFDAMKLKENTAGAFPFRILTHKESSAGSYKMNVRILDAEHHEIQTAMLKITVYEPEFSPESIFI